jgi:hypothetical protein
MLPETKEPGPVLRTVRRHAREIGAVLWSSFLAAAVASVCFFATFDPVVLHDDAEFLRAAFSPRMTGYTLGFFFFWAFTLLAASLTLYLIRGSPPVDPPDMPAERR